MDRSIRERGDGRTWQGRPGPAQPGQNQGLFPSDGPYGVHQSLDHQHLRAYRNPPANVAAPNRPREWYSESRSHQLLSSPSHNPDYLPPASSQQNARRSDVEHRAYYQPPPRFAHSSERYFRPGRTPPFEQQYRRGPPQTPYPRHGQGRDEQQSETLLSNDHVRSASYSSRMTASTLGTIPDFPDPVRSTLMSTKNTITGSSSSNKRVVQSSYSHTSWASPIPEESRFNETSLSNAAGQPVDDSGWREDEENEKINGELVGDRGSSIYDDAMESHLVHSVSLEQRGEPVLVQTRSAPSLDKEGRPWPSPVQTTETADHHAKAAFVSSGTLPTAKVLSGKSSPKLAEDDQISTKCLSLSSSVAENAFHRTSDSETHSMDQHILATRRPERLDMDVIRDAEARGSLTSLSDLIRRATKLATMLENGKRPPSRLDDLSAYLHEKLGSGENRPGHTRSQSGLSDLLATFPTPLETKRQSRRTWLRTTSWPLVSGGGEDPRIEDGKTPKQRRKCCGMPLWLFALFIILLACIIAAAITIPLEYFVFKNLGNHKSDQSDLKTCSLSLVCQNGGISTLSQGECICVCTNGFTGSDCGQAISSACMTTSLSSLDGSENTSNVTLGRAIPRLLTDAKSNFSIPLSASDIVAKLSSGGVSCIAQNSLVTFEGHWSRLGDSDAAVQQDHENRTVAVDAGRVVVSIVTTTSTTTVDLNQRSATELAVSTMYTSHLLLDTSTVPYAGPSKTSLINNSEATKAASTQSFNVTQEVLDFARVAVLYILQDGDIDDANETQSNLQSFFASADSKTSISSASNITIVPGKTVNLVDYTIDRGNETIGHGFN